MKEWRFNRYRIDRHGYRRLMAEGAIVHAATYEEALEKARKFFPATDELVLRVTESGAEK